jgi:hypothetical protein
VSTARLHGERGHWIYSEIDYAPSQFNKFSRQLLFVSKISTDAYTYSLTPTMVGEGSVIIVPRWHRFGDIDFCLPSVLETEFKDVIDAFLVRARLLGNWNPEQRHKFEEP